ncbi:TMEM175 family protein [Kitasatospora viridis]|uniref:Putative membrane protein n=1 Tax=Kitasatospora viridis TaxID=281105 RepID=A0A561TT66_9ACTN|nr:TMEM175 family protein [Kitasatospora viridis]TWF90309.1 putative membrane protein [Kitasatospora viridis]
MSSQPSRFRRADTGRVEAFSDGVFAIAITILVLDLHPPAHPPGGLGHALLEQWPAYVGYLTSFAYIGVIWLNHHQAFTRLRSTDAGLHAANLSLLFTTAALPFPTAVVSTAFQHSLSDSDARTAVLLYACVAAAMCLSWYLLFRHLERTPALHVASMEPSFPRHGMVRSAAGVVGYLAAGLVGWAVQPVIAAVVFLLLPAFYGLTTEGLIGRRPVGS